MLSIAVVFHISIGRQNLEVVAGLHEGNSLREWLVVAKSEADEESSGTPQGRLHAVKKKCEVV